MEDKNLQKQYWGQHLWARGYFVASSGNITDEMIKEYISRIRILKRMMISKFQAPKWASAQRQIYWLYPIVV